MMTFNNWQNHLNRIREFYNSDFFQEICNKDENIITELLYGYITAIGENQVCDQVCQKYYGENSNFWVDYLIEDFLNFGYCLVPIVIISLTGSLNTSSLTGKYD